MRGGGSELGLDSGIVEYMFRIRNTLGFSVWEGLFRKTGVQAWERSVAW